MPQPPPRAAIVIPTYNRASMLRRQLQTLAGQRFPMSEVEVIVADDGSSDHTAEVVREFRDTLRIAYYYQDDRGFRAAAARNGGAALATAPVLIFMDTGVLAGPDFVAAHLEANERAVVTSSSPGALVLGCTYGYRPWDPFEGLAEIAGRHSAIEVVRRHGHDPAFQDMRYTAFAGHDFDLSRLHAPWTYCWTVNVSLRATDFWQVGGFDEAYRSWGGEDVELAFRLTRHGVKMVASTSAWALDLPHERDREANDASSERNLAIMWDRHREPLTEIYTTMYRRGEWNPPLESDYQELLDWTAMARDIEVADEIGRACAHLATRPLPTGARRPRVAVIGCGRLTGEDLSILDADWTLFDFDAAFHLDPAVHLDSAFQLDPLSPKSTSPHVEWHHGIGLRTTLADASHDMVVVTSRLRGVWPRWGDAIAAEARRVGHTVAIPFLDGLTVF